MGIYYYAVNTNKKEYFSAPDDWAIKSPGCFHPSNPFPGMVVMKRIQGFHFDIWDDCSNDVPPENDYKDITQEVWNEYREEFKDFYDNEEE